MKNHLCPSNANVMRFLLVTVTDTLDIVVHSEHTLVEN